MVIHRRHQTHLYIPLCILHSAFAGFPQRRFQLKSKSIYFEQSALTVDVHADAIRCCSLWS